MKKADTYEAGFLYVKIQRWKYCKGSKNEILRKV
jgi:hypothetical protein